METRRNKLKQTSKLRGSPLKLMLFVLLLAFAALNFGCYPRKAYHLGKHKADFDAISDWLKQRGFKPKKYEQVPIIGTGTTEHYADYQWYRGTYINDCTGNVIVSISEQDKLQVSAFYDGCPDHEIVSEQALPDLVRGIERLYEDRKQTVRQPSHD